MPMGVSAAIAELLRIKARSIRSGGALLKLVEPKQGANQNIKVGANPKVTRKGAAKAAGISTSAAHRAEQGVVAKCVTDVTREYCD